MQITAATVGIPVRDLDAAVAWYQSTFGLGQPDLIPMEGLAEFDLGRFWLQLAAVPARAGTAGMTLNISVADAAAEHRRFADMGRLVSDLERVEGVVEYFELIDLDGNKIGFVTELT